VEGKRYGPVCKRYWSQIKRSGPEVKSYGSEIKSYESEIKNYGGKAKSHGPDVRKAGNGGTVTHRDVEHDSLHVHLVDEEDKGLVPVRVQVARLDARLLLLADALALEREQVEG
jgi:hypothetical protein